MNKLNRSYLLFATFFFCIGLIAGVYLNSVLLMIGITLFCCAVMLIISRFISVRFHLLFASIMYLLGIVFMHANFPLQNELLDFEDESFFIAKIDEQLRKGNQWETDIITVEQIYENNNWTIVDEKILMLCETSSELILSGDRILVKSKFIPIQNKGNPGEFNAENYWLSKGVRYQCFGFTENVHLIDEVEVPFMDELLDNVRSYSVSVITTFVNENSRGLAQAILLGDKSNLDTETKNSFVNAGAIHVLAVSGLHVGIIAYLLNAIFQFIFKGRNRKLAIWLTLIILWFYAFITGFSPSVTRAVLMFSILIGSQLFARNYSSINSLAFAAIILLVWNPLYLFDPGFQLSFLAMLGIFLIYEKIEGLFYIKNQFLKKVWQGTAVGLSAQVFTIPLSLYLFYQFPNYFILSNLGVMLFSNVILGGGIALVVFGKIPFLNVWIGWFLGFAILGLIITVDWVQKLPGAVAYGFHPSLFWTITAYVIIITLLVFMANKKRAWQVSSVLILSIVLLQWNRHENLNKNEICFFNANHPTVMINHSGQQICLYSGDEDGFLNAQMLVSNYHRIHPGETKFIEVGKNQIQLKSNSDSISVSRQRFYMDLVLNSTKYRLVTSARHWLKKEEMKNEIVINAPYMGEQKEIAHHLKSGAFHCQLSTF